MNIPYINKIWNIPNIEKIKNTWKALFKRKELFKYMPKTGEEKKNTFVNTYVFDSSHKKVKGFAGLRGMDVPEAYDMLVCAGLKALGYDPATFK